MTKYNLSVDDDIFYKQLYVDYGKNREELQEYIELITNWAESQKHFPEVPAENMVRYTLIANKFSIEKTKEKIDMYYTVRSLIPEYFEKHPLSPELIFHSEIVYCIPLPKTTSTLQRIIYCRVNPDRTPGEFSHELLNTQIIHAIEILLQQDKCYKFHFICDVIGAKFGHIPKFSPMHVRKMVIILEVEVNLEASTINVLHPLCVGLSNYKVWWLIYNFFPEVILSEKNVVCVKLIGLKKVFANRIAGIYIVNFQSFMQCVLNTLFMSLLPQKLQDRVKISSDTNILFETFGKDVLPEDIGGEEQSLANLRISYLEKCKEWNSRFDKIQYMKVNESLRSATLKNDSILGYYGSFKKINID